MVLTTKEIKKRLIAWKREHLPAFSKMGRAQLIYTALKFAVIKADELTEEEIKSNATYKPPPVPKAEPRKLAPEYDSFRRRVLNRMLKDSIAHLQRTPDMYSDTVLVIGGEEIHLLKAEAADLKQLKTVPAAAAKPKKTAREMDSQTEPPPKKHAAEIETQTEPPPKKHAAEIETQTETVKPPVDPTPTDREKELKKGFLEQLKDKYDVSKLEKLEKFELIDIVNKAKCGKLKGLDTETMSKDEIIEHLHKSKCPEVHSMLLEITHLKSELTNFVDKYIEDGGKITKENVYYSGIQLVIPAFFLYDAWKNKRYDCILSHSDVFDANDNFFFKILNNNDDTLVSNIDKVAKGLAKQMTTCLNKGVKVIAIPIGHHEHANVIIYRVDANTFERYEPHGSFTITKHKFLSAERAKLIEDSIKNLYYYHHNIGSIVVKGQIVEEKFETTLRNYFSKQAKEEPLQWKFYYNILYTNPGVIWQLLSKRFDMRDEQGNHTRRLLKQLQKLQRVEHIEDNSFENINRDIDAKMKLVFIDYLGKHNPIFASASYLPPNMVSLNWGIQALEPSQVKTKYNLSTEEYKMRIGGFCVMWSILYMDLVFRHPEATPVVLNENLLAILKSKGEDGFAKLALGYLQNFKIKGRTGMDREGEGG
jgi:hypothetical protein